MTRVFAPPVNIRVVGIYFLYDDYYYRVYYVPEQQQQRQLGVNVLRKLLDQQQPPKLQSFLHLINIFRKRQKNFQIFADFFSASNGANLAGIFSMSKIGVRSKTNDISINPATPFSSLPTIYKKGVDSPSFPRCISVLTLSTMVYCATKSGAAHIRKKKGGIIQIMTLMSAAVVRHSRP